MKTTAKKITLTFLLLVMGETVPALAAQDESSAQSVKKGAITADANGVLPSLTTVVASVNGEDILLAHMIALRQTLPAEYDNLEPRALFQAILEQLIQQTLFKQALGDPSFEDRIRLENATRSYLSGVEKNRVVKNAVTQEAIQKAYKEGFSSPPETEYNAAHILVEDRNRAYELRRDLNDGADFEELAKKYSIDRGSAELGGDLGWFTQGRMIKTFEDAVISAKPGKVVGPIETQFGWHIILLRDKRVVGEDSLEEAQQGIAKLLNSEAISARLDELMKNAKISDFTSTPEVQALDAQLLDRPDLLTNYQDETNK